MNSAVIGLIYLIAAPMLLYLASKAYYRPLFRVLLGVAIVLSFVPIYIGISVIKIAAEGGEWDLWNYAVAIGGIFCIVFGIAALLPMLWMAKQEKPTKD